VVKQTSLLSPIEKFALTATVTTLWTTIRVAVRSVEQDASHAVHQFRLFRWYGLLVSLLIGRWLTFLPGMFNHLNLQGNIRH